MSRDRLPPVDDVETFKHADLIGLAAVPPDGTSLGTVSAIHTFGAGDVIEIKPESGDSMLVTFTSVAVPEIDMNARRMTVVLPVEVE